MSEPEATLPGAADVPPRSGPPTLADQVAAIDAVAVAARIVAREGTRAAIGASATEIIAMAQMVMRLTTLADLTFDMLIAADAAYDEQQPDPQRQLRRAARGKIELVGAALEALGYRNSPAKEEEKPHGSES